MKWYITGNVKKISFPFSKDNKTSVGFGGFFPQSEIGCNKNSLLELYKLSFRYFGSSSKMQISQKNQCGLWT